MSEMSREEKEAMHKSVLAGDIDLLMCLLNQPNADINMTWFSENLLMTSIRAGQECVAEFLLDNGIDHNFTTTRINIVKLKSHSAEYYTMNCRQMAYEADMFYVVERIDDLNGELWSSKEPAYKTVRDARIQSADKLNRTSAQTKRRVRALSETESASSTLLPRTQRLFSQPVVKCKDKPIVDNSK